MTSDPIDQEKLRAARKWATNTLNRGVLTPPLEHCDAAAELILSLPEPAPTMADIEWDDAVHHLAEAEHENGLKVVMLAPIRSEYGEVVAISCDMDGEHVDYHPDNLTPNGNRHRLVLAEWKGSPVLDRQPGTTEPAEESHRDPQPGEAWRFKWNGNEFDGLVTRQRNALGKMSDIVTFVDRSGAERTEYMDEVKPTSRLAPVVEPRVLRTVEDYENAPNGTVVHQGISGIAHRKNCWVWKLYGVESVDSTDMAGTPRTVIWEPGGGA